jgi:putative membrane protein
MTAAFQFAFLISPELITDWTWPPAIVIPMALVFAMYAIGVVKMWLGPARSSIRLRCVLCFVAGWISLLLALDSPIHELGEQLFWVHMTQHEILMLISAPLLVLGRPLIPFLYALNPHWRRRAGDFAHLKLIRSSWATISSPAFAWLFSALALWIWHVPWLFNRTLHNDWIHAAQHTSFLASALLFWWPLANMKPGMGYGAGVLYVFTTAMHTSILGALLTFTSRAWYAPYISTAPLWHLTALEDQQLGGLIMWIPAGTLLLVVALWLLVRWIEDSQARWQLTRMAELTHASQGGLK